MDKALVALVRSLDGIGWLGLALEVALVAPGFDSHMQRQERSQGFGEIFSKCSEVLNGLCVCVYCTSVFSF